MPCTGIEGILNWQVMFGVLVIGIILGWALSILVAWLLRNRNDDE